MSTIEELFCLWEESIGIDKREVEVSKRRDKVCEELKLNRKQSELLDELYADTLCAGQHIGFEAGFTLAMRLMANVTGGKV